MRVGLVYLWWHDAEDVRKGAELSGFDEVICRGGVVNFPGRALSKFSFLS